MAKWKITAPLFHDGRVVPASKAHPAIIDLPDTFKPVEGDKFIMPVDAVIELGRPAHPETKGRGRPRKSFEPKDSNE